MKWVITKLDEHDKMLQDIFQLLREMKKDVDLSNQKFILDVIQQYEEVDDEEDENDSEVPTE